MKTYKATFVNMFSREVTRTIDDIQANDWDEADYFASEMEWVDEEVSKVEEVK